MSLPIVSIIGRPNVGKSSLFNALVGHTAAIVSNRSGVTRDRQFTKLKIDEHNVWLVDTAGIAQDSDKLTNKMCEQSWQAADQSDLNLFVVAEQLNDADVKLIREIQKKGKPLVLLINKADLSKDHEALINEFARLGVKEPRLVSATTKTGIQSLREHIQSLVPAVSPPEVDTHTIALVGKPNAGKSTLINLYAKEDRCIVSPIAGTTRDSITIEHEHGGQKYYLTDTAGMRRKSRINDDIEQYATGHTLRSIENASVVVHMIDATESVTRQDFRIAQLCLEMGKAVIIAINKIDLLNKQQRQLLAHDIKVALHHIPHIPTFELSASQGRNTKQLMTLATGLCQEFEKRFSTSMLTRMLEKIVKRTPPPSRLGRPINLRMVHLSNAIPLEITIHGKRTSYVPKSYIRYLHNSFLKAMGIRARIIKIKLKSDDNPYV